MTVYRITRSKYAHDLSGAGAEKYGGRWNSPGNPVLYTSTNASLALLETLAWTSLNQLVQSEFVLLKIAVSARPKYFSSPIDVPADWNSEGDYLVTRKIGDSWLGDCVHLAISVPSAILPIEQNILINPKHKSSSLLKIEETFDIVFDERILAHLER